MCPKKVGEGLSTFFVYPHFPQEMQRNATGQVWAALRP